MLEHKEAIISHLSWASLFLGFHILGLYVHNDVMLAFGTPEMQILIEPTFAQWIQSAHGKTSYGFDILLSSTNGPTFNAGRSIWLPGWLTAINENSNSLFLTIGPGDFLVHHAIALGLHTTTLILVKGVLDARGSKLMPDKKDFGYSFPCDGPGRGDKLHDNLLPTAGNSEPPPPTLPLLAASPSTSPPLPIKKLSPTEMQQRRAEGLCYNCPAKYQPGHQCNPPKFLLLQSENEPPWPYLQQTDFGLANKAIS
ncbi:unnamed protein product [Lactuca virosa]|uniref:Photosystem I chlorophyll a apoprotein A2 n=1 Tax=Lactuca virosa TaxID=75947 RepID=A0AAU9LQV6_9ASTR|nr:unnamed protein product [Lactuca virosa]